jgi:hypothetical protein
MKKIRNIVRTIIKEKYSYLINENDSNLELDLNQEDLN